LLIGKPENQILKDLILQGQDIHNPNTFVKCIYDIPQDNTECLEEGKK